MKKLFWGAEAMPSRWADAALLLFRLHIGLSIAIGAGWGKLGSVTNVAPDWFIKQVEEIGFSWPTPYLWAGLACWGELVGGLLLAVGLLTWLSAVQLAFQFFVIAFVWYGEPEFLVGMNYQQLLFWSYVLVAATGPGRFSLDYWLMRRKQPAPVPLASAAAVAPLVSQPTTL